jgi:hypothetical protein
MTALDVTTKPLPPERSLYLQRTATQALQVLERFSSGTVEYSPVALQLLDEWIDRLGRRGSLPIAGWALVVAFLGQTFLHRHGGYWAIQMRGQKRELGVVCPVAGTGDAMRFIDIAGQANRRLAHGISDSLAFFYLSTSVDLQGHS